MPDDQEFMGLPSRFRFYIATTAFTATEEFGGTEFASSEEAQAALDGMGRPHHYIVHKVEKAN